MGLERATLLACAVLGTLLATAILYFTAAPLLGLWPAPTPEAPIPMANVPLIPPFVWWLISIFAVALLATAWIGFYRNRSIEFFPTRHILHEKYLSLERRVSGVSTLWAIWAVGTKFIDSQSKSVMKRLILPNPGSSSAKFYFNSIDQNHARLDIRSTTSKAIKAGIEVRWCGEFFFHSITIADPSSPDGWVYIEHALPYYLTEERPGYTIHRKGQPETVSVLISKFEEIWNKAKVVTDEELAIYPNVTPQLEPMHKVISHVAARILDSDASKFWPSARRAIRQAALDGSIQIYGQKSEDTGNSNGTSWSLVSVPIPRNYWELADITEIAVSPEHADELMHNTRPHRLSDGRFTQEKIEYYAKLMVKWSEVNQKWP